jgi:hypothetical protein
LLIKVRATLTAGWSFFRMREYQSYVVIRPKPASVRGHIIFISRRGRYATSKSVIWVEPNGVLDNSEFDGTDGFVKFGTNQSAGNTLPS